MKNLKRGWIPPASILRGINARARANQHTIVFAEGDDPRILRAAVL
jgi:malate dehydrogenase (oxaloacetate-decarboxylating)(NADP+)